MWPAANHRAAFSFSPEPFHNHVGSADRSPHVIVNEDWSCNNASFQMTSTPPTPRPVPSMRPFVPVHRTAVLSSSRAAPAMSAVPLGFGRGPLPAPAGGASTAAPACGAGCGAPVHTHAGTGAPAPTPRTSISDLMRDVANACMNSMANINMCLKIVGVTSLYQRCLSKNKKVVSVRLLQFGCTTMDLEEPYMAFEWEKTAQRELQLVYDELDTRYMHKLGEFRSRIPLNAVGRVSQNEKAYSWAPGLGAPFLGHVAPNGIVYVTRFAPSKTTPPGSGSGGAAGRGPTFMASRFARLLHVMPDGRTLSGRNLLAIPCDRDRLDREPVCPWADHFSPLFNEPTFRPAKAPQYVNGVMASNVEGINPSALQAEGHRRRYSPSLRLSNQTARRLYPSSQKVANSTPWTSRASRAERRSSHTAIASSNRMPALS
jgi:hypothetical protein